MALILQLKIDQVIAEDDTLASRLLDRHPQSVNSSMSEGGTPGILKLDPEDADVAVGMGSIADAKYIYIESDYPITAKLNGTGNFAIPLTPTVDGVGVERVVVQKGMLLLKTAGITSIHLSNPAQASDAVTDVNSDAYDLLIATVLVVLLGD